MEAIHLHSSRIAAGVGQFAWLHNLSPARSTALETLELTGMWCRTFASGSRTANIVVAFMPFVWLSIGRG